MIWVRRILAIPLIVIFIITFILALVLNHVSGTVGSAGFYNGQMDKADVYNWVYDNLTPTALDEAEFELPSDFPIDDQEFKEDIVGVVKKAFPPEEWLKPTFEGATGAVVPYLVGDKDTITIPIPVQGSIDDMVEGINGVVDDHIDEIYDYVMDELIVPEVMRQLESGADLPYGITLTDEEIRVLVKQAVTEDWAGDQFMRIVDRIAAYLTTDGVENLDVDIDLRGLKSTATTAAKDLVEQKLQAAFNSIQVNCSEAEFINELNSDPNAMPSCKPAGYTYDQFKQALETAMGTTMAEEINETVIAEIPDSYTFDDAEFRDAMGEDMEEQLDRAREFILVDGEQITLEDLSDSEDTETLDNVRHTVHTVRTWLWALWLIPILLLVAIGFLCGRNWKSRLLWALSVLLVVSLILIIVIAVARTFVPDEIVKPSDGGEDFAKVGESIALKADEIVHNAINTFVWGLEVKLIICIVVSVLAIAGVIAWYIVEKRRRRQMEQETPAAPPAQT